MPEGAISGWLLCPFDMALVVLVILLSIITRFLKFIWYIILQFWKYFSKELFPCSGKWYVGTLVRLLALLIAHGVKYFWAFLLDRARMYFRKPKSKKRKKKENQSWMSRNWIKNKIRRCLFLWTWSPLIYLQPKTNVCIKRNEVLIHVTFKIRC